MEFVAIDVETANADMASICQIGIAVYERKKLTEEWKTLINPEDYFHPINVSIHGISEMMVKDSPLISDVSNELYRFLDNRIAVCHTHFDRVAVRQAVLKYGLREPHCTWLDSARVARRSWDVLARSGYGLDNVCKHLGYAFKHHDALEDAKAAAFILNAAIDNSGLDLDGWLKRIQQPIDPTKSCSDEAIRRNGNPEGPMHGEVLVFTGALAMPRNEAADLADRIGCQVDAGVTKRTTILVVGDQDIKKLAGYDKSAKHRKAENLISNGQSIRIIRETDFIEIIRVVLGTNAISINSSKIADHSEKQNSRRQLGITIKIKIGPDTIQSDRNSRR